MKEQPKLVEEQKAEPTQFVTKPSGLSPPIEEIPIPRKTISNENSNQENIGRRENFKEEKKNNSQAIPLHSHNKEPHIASTLLNDSKTNPSEVKVKAEHTTTKRKTVRRDDYIEQTETSEIHEEIKVEASPSIIQEEYEAKATLRKEPQSSPVNRTRFDKADELKKPEEDNLGEKVDQKALESSLTSGPLYWTIVAMSYWQLVAGIIIGMIISRLFSL